MLIIKERRIWCRMGNPPNHRLSIAVMSFSFRIFERIRTFSNAVMSSFFRDFERIRKISNAVMSSFFRVIERIRTFSNAVMSSFWRVFERIRYQFWSLSLNWHQRLLPTLFSAKVSTCSRALTTLAATASEAGRRHQI